ncbi:MAG: peptidoglycan bridge formation glycyltransferase FemA/FemB family protein [Anaerolineae bacterium]|nr:peptidoglycan bridge formation glycyltransferase FemA/FemB family protein [Anaerolineae bacterium]
MASTNEPFSGEEWDRMVAAADGHLLQTWPWGELKARFGWQVGRVAAGPALAQVLFRPLPVGLGSIAYVPRGPAGSLEPAALADLLAAIRPMARRRGAICLKIEPDREEDEALAGELRAAGFRPSTQDVQPRRTLVVDLQGEADAILARMKQKTRYNVRLAARKGVSVRPGSEEDLPAFYGLMEETARRDGFGIHTRAYYEAAHELFVSGGRGCLLLAEHEGQLLAGLVAMAFERAACYMYGASSGEKRELMPTYLLQWEAMLWARQRGCLYYDLWGVPDEEEETLEAGFAERSDGLWGVYRFKRGFGGRLVRTAGAWDLVYSPLRYGLYNVALALRERLVGLRRRGR